jgi:hypothetical protein
MVDFLNEKQKNYILTIEKQLYLQLVIEVK